MYRKLLNLASLHPCLTNLHPFKSDWRKCTHHLTNLDLLVCAKHYTFAAFDLSNRNN